MPMPRHFAAIILTLAISGCIEKEPPPVSATPSTDVAMELEKKCLLLEEAVNTQSNRADHAISEHQKEIEANAPLRRTIDTLISDKNTAQGYIETMRKEMEAHERTRRRTLKELQELRAAKDSEQEALITSKEREHKQQIIALETKIKSLETRIADSRKVSEEKLNTSQTEQKRLRDLLATRARENEISRMTQTREHEKKVASLQATIKTLEARIASLESASTNTSNNAQ